MLRITEQPSLYDNLEKKSVLKLVTEINQENMKVALAINENIPAIERMISAIEKQLKAGGRMFYLGCGTGGRLTVCDIVELPTTFGIEKGMINSILGGGLDRFVEAPEEREDVEEEGIEALQANNISPKDIVIGVSASGTTPFVLAAMTWCQEHGIPCGSFVNNPNSPISAHSDYPVEIVMGPEYVTGSTRMKCGICQKMMCDIISTTVLIRLGRVQGNRMVEARLINNKVIDRLVRILMDRNPKLTDYDFCKENIVKFGNVLKVEEYFKKQDIL